MIDNFILVIVIINISVLPKVCCCITLGRYELKPQAKLKQIGVTFQDPDDQLFNATVQKEVAWGLSQIESDQLMIKKAVGQALIAVGLADKAAENPYDLSLSERKLLTFATVLAINPAIYLFDEPMMSLDWPSRKRMTNIFHQLVKSGHQVITRFI